MFTNQERKGDMKTQRLLKPLLAFMALVLCFGSVRAHSQVATAQINGSVHDQTDALVPGAQVTATQTSTGVQTVVNSNRDGLFVLQSLAIGPYTISVTAPGFRTFQQTQLVLSVGQQLTLDVKLLLGASDQTVTIMASAVAVDTTTPTQQSVVEQRTIQDLPLDGRNPADLEYTVAGVNNGALNLTFTTGSSTIKEADSSNPQESAPSVHGARPGGTYFSMDGANNTDPWTVVGGPFPNPDATGEFSVVTGTYGARYVSAPGGAVNIVARSGANDIHGTVFEFIRNGAVNAENAISQVPDILKRNQFGFAAGGPIKRDKLFVFASYQGTITRYSTPGVAYVPTASQRTGNFGTFQIPTSMISPAIQKYLANVPLGDPVTGKVSYQTPDNSTDKQALIKFDYVLKDHRLFARAFYDRYIQPGSDPTAAGGILAESPGVTQPWTSFAVGDNWSHGKWLIQSRASFVQALADQNVHTNLSTYSGLGITGMTGTLPSPGYSLFYILNGFEGNSGSVTRFPRKEFEFADDAFATLGKHQISFGVNYRYVRANEVNLSDENPIAVFVGVNSLIDGLYGIIPHATQNAMADFILGQPYQFIQADGIFANVGGNLIGFYGEDTYHASDHLSITAGLRWDPFLPYNVAGQRITCFVPGEQSQKYANSFPGEVFPGDPNCPNNGARASYNQFQPRVGLAYGFDGGKSSLRAGFGLYDLQAPLQPYAKFSGQPFTRTYSLSGPGFKIDNFWPSTAYKTDPFASGFQGPNFVPPSTTAFVPGLTLATFDTNMRPAYIQQWSLSLQHLFTSTDSLELAYNGTAGVHLPINESLNTPVYTGSPTTSTTGNEAARRPYTNFGIVGDLTSAATSSYNGLDVTYKHEGKFVRVNSVFTWSKALDDNSAPGFGSSVSIPNTNHNFRRGRSDYDQNLVSRTTGTFVLPSLHSSNAFTRSVLGSWTASGLVILDAGQPFSVGDGADNSFTGLGIDYADRVANQPVYLNGRLNLNAFTTNAPGTFGNSGRNAYRGPAYLDVDTALMKSFPVWRESNLLFRIEAFNLLNHPNYFPPNSTYSPTAQATFGIPTNARDPRILQAAVKINF